jgi:carboxypeptidase family protein
MRLQKTTARVPQHLLNRLCIAAAIAALVSIVPATAQSPGGKSQTVPAESGLDLLVLDPQGAVCAGAQIELAKNGEAGTLRWNTDQEGKATIQASAGDYWLTIKLRGFLDYQKRLTLRPDMRTALTATLWIGESDDPIPVPREDLVPVIQADTPLLDLVPISDSKPAKPGLWQRFRRLLHLQK